MQILLIEDDIRISTFLSKGLTENGHLVTLCKNAESVLKDYLSLSFDLIICDIMLPGMDGIQLVQTLRFKNIFTPILMLSALNAVQDKVAALDSGADDYISKPFHFDELLSRIHALTRRNHYAQKEAPAKVIQYSDFILDLDRYRLEIQGVEVVLSPR